MVKPPIWSLQPPRVARRWQAHWRNVKAVFPFWEPAGHSIHPLPSQSAWQLGNGATRHLTRHGPAVYFPSSSTNEVATSERGPTLGPSSECRQPSLRQRASRHRRLTYPG